MAVRKGDAVPSLLLVKLSFAYPDHARDLRHPDPLWQRPYLC